MRKLRPKQSKKAKIKKIKKQLFIDRVAFRKQQPYSDFLKGKYWQQVRKSVLKRDKNMCIICKLESNLQVHHDTYKNHGDEMNHLEDLMTLCRKCHKEHHDAQK